MDTSNKTLTMNISLRMDREIDESKHYISPGGYEFRFSSGDIIQFDFMTSYGYIDEDDKHLVNFHLEELDFQSFPDSNKLIELLEDDCCCLEEITECFIYTGEHGDPEINAVSIEAICLDIESDDYVNTIVIPDDLIPETDYYDDTTICGEHGCDGCVLKFADDISLCERERDIKNNNT